MRKSYKKMTESEFNQIKAMFNAGVKPAVVEKLTNRSYFTVHYVDKSIDFNDYKKRVIEYGKIHWGKTKTMNEKQVTLQPKGSENELINVLNKINANLERLCLACEAKPKGLFH